MLLINEQVNSLIESNLEVEMIWSNPNSVSRIHVLFETVGKGKIVLELVRHLSPITFSKLIKKIPISGRLHFLNGNIGYVETGLNLGAEKQKSVFKM
jgi:hypothetical protein